MALIDPKFGPDANKANVPGLKYRGSKRGPDPRFKVNSNNIADSMRLGQYQSAARKAGFQNVAGEPDFLANVNARATQIAKQQAYTNWLRNTPKQPTGPQNVGAGGRNVPTKNVAPNPLQEGDAMKAARGRAAGWANEQRLNKQYDVSGKTAQLRSQLAQYQMKFSAQPQAGPPYKNPNADVASYISGVLSNPDATPRQLEALANQAKDLATPRGNADIGKVDTGWLGKVGNFVSSAFKTNATAGNLEGQLYDTYYKQNPGLYAKMTGFDAQVIKPSIEMLNAPIEEVMKQPFYAAQLSDNQGRGFWQSMRTGVSALPGLGFVDNTKAGKEVRAAVDSEAKRQELTAAGKLESFGQHLAHSMGLKEAKGFDWFSFVSGGSDFLFNVVGDPLTWVAGGSNKAAKLGETWGAIGERQAAKIAGRSLTAAEAADARQAGRMWFAKETTVGKQLIDTTEAAIAKRSGDVDGIKGILRLTTGSEADAFAEKLAKASVGKNEVKDLLTEALGKGLWEPDITFRREIAIRLLRQQGLGTGGMPLFLGKDAINPAAGLAKQAVEKLAGRSSIQLGDFTDPVKVIKAVSERAGWKAADTIGVSQYEDVWYLTVGSATAGKTNPQRILRLLQDARAAGNEELVTLVNAAKRDVLAAGVGKNAKVAEELLKRLEVTAALSEGLAGQDAADVVQQVFLGSWVPKKPSSVVDLLMQANMDAHSVSGLPSATPLDPALMSNNNMVKLFLNKKNPANVLSLRVRIDQLPASVADMFTEHMNLVLGDKKTADLSGILSMLRAVEGDSKLLDSAERVLAQYDIRAAARVAAKDAARKTPFYARLAEPMAKLYLSIAEAAPPSMIRLKGADKNILRTEQRAAITALMNDLGMDSLARKEVFSVFSNAKTEMDVVNVVDSVYREFFAFNSIDPDMAMELLKGQERWRSFAEKALPGSHGKRSIITMAEDPLTKAPATRRIMSTQAFESFPVFDGSELKRIARQVRAIADEATVSDKLRAGVGRVADARVRMGPVGLKHLNGDDFLLRDLAKFIHKAWKFSVVTNIPTSVATGTAFGLYYAGHNDGNDFVNFGKGFGIGMAVGLAGASRYILRVAGIEERARYLLTRGFTPTEWVPGLAKHWAERGLPEHMLPDAYAAVRSGGGVHMANYMNVANAALSTVGDDWELLGASKNLWTRLERRNTRFIDGWYRLVQHQTHETDPVAMMLLHEFSGRPGANLIEDNLMKWLKTTDDGRLWMRRMREGIGAGRYTEKNVIENVREYIRQVFVTPELAELRLQAAENKVSLERGVLKQFAKAGKAPSEIFAQRTWIIPRSGRELAQTLSDLPSKLVLSGPSAKLSREPMFRAEYRDEYNRLVKYGGKLTDEEIKSIAQGRAADRVNRIMFNLNGESRFAKRMDYVTPFQQPREEMIRVYAKIARDNPARVLQVGRMAAVGFNNGKESGTFRKDPLSGNWYMTIPGAMQLGSLLFGKPFSEDYNIQISLNSLMFIGQGTFAEMGPLASVLPVPGGPYWLTASKVLANVYPQFYRNLKDQHPAVYQLVFPYGVQGYIFRPEARRFWMGLMGSPAPWEFLTGYEQSNEIARWRGEMFKHLYWRHLQKNPKDMSYLPTADEVDEAVMQMFTAWGLMGTFIPASSRVQLPYRAEMESVQKLYTDRNGTVHWDEMFADNPWLDAFYTQSKTFVGEDSYKAWTGDFDTLTENMLRSFKYNDDSKLRAEVQKQRRSTQAWQEFFTASGNPLWYEREDNISKWQQKYPDIAAEASMNYHRDKDLSVILTQYPLAGRQPAIDRWRKQYNASYSDYLRSARKIGAGEFKVNPWKEARLTPDILTVVGRMRSTQNMSEDVAVANLQPAEQVKYWQHRKATLSYSPGSQDPSDILAEWTSVNRRISAIYKAHPELLTGKSQPKKHIWDAAWHMENMRALATSQVTKAVDQAYEQIKLLTAQREEAVKAALARTGSWDAYYAIKPQIDAQYDIIRTLQNGLYERFPAFGKLQDEVFGLSALMTGFEAPETVTSRLVTLDKFQTEIGLKFLPTNEQAAYLRMSPAVRKAYVDDLLTFLLQGSNMKEDTRYAGERGRVFWHYLTKFQQDIIEANAPDIAEQLKRESAAKLADDAKLADMQSRLNDLYKRKDAAYKRKDWKTYQSLKAQVEKLKAEKDAMKALQPKPGAEADLDWVEETLKQYGGDRATPPDSWPAYLNLPDVDIVRQDFLKKHPELVAWLKDSPLNKMPDVLRFMITETVRKYAAWSNPDAPAEDAATTTTKKSSGKRRGYGGNVDLNWAFSQLRQWSRRGGKTKPATYDIWVNMPTGIEKAQYMRDHPEIAEWIQLGPMSNMPDAYKDVIRDIMQKYGKWTQEADNPLAQTLQEYYSTPQYARAQFLELHPELVEYWRAMRSPEDQALYDLNDQYFAIPDATAKRLFLAAHPQLQQFFIDQRTKRYERFLNRVAFYMGSNPDLFTQYLTRQNDILAELLRKYAEPALIPERIPEAKVTSKHAA